MAGTIPDIHIDEDCEVAMSEAFEEFCQRCDQLYKRVAHSPAPPQKEFKKDSRYWLHKNRNRRSQQKYSDDGELTYDQVFSVIGKSGRRFKKDSRVWLHKSSDRAYITSQLQKNCNCNGVPRTNVDKRVTLRNKVTTTNPIFLNCSMKVPDQLCEKLRDAGCGRKRKRGEFMSSAPSSPAKKTESNLATLSRSLDRDVGITRCVNRMDGDAIGLLRTASTETVYGSSSDEVQQKSPWPDFQAMSDNTSSNKLDGDHSPASSDGSTRLINEQCHDSAPNSDTSRGDLMDDQVSLHFIVEESRYDPPITPPGSPWQEQCGEMDVEVEAAFSEDSNSELHWRNFNTNN
ncbi:uncharacterized protein LOC124261253 [Haliotis rubra]|uniref:uncharacterized protein LOC124261253 n=1 Tax=Haliotis rubra TaxID=36100 RepID=UPI001EE57CFA|nr:uncharacterized protein LOC124261253 [Haliotis rubra]